MRNKVSFFNLWFLLLFLGKVGGIGKLGTIGWWLVFTPLLLDLLLDFINKLGYIDKAINYIRTKIMMKKLQDIVDREKSAK